MMDDSSRSNMSVDSICSPTSTKQYKLSNNENGINGVAVQKSLKNNSDFVLRHKEVLASDNNSNFFKNRFYVLKIEFRTN